MYVGVFYLFLFSFLVNCAGAKDDPQCNYISNAEPGTPQCDLSKGYAMKIGGPTIPEMCPGKCGYCKSKSFIKCMVSSISKLSDSMT